MVVHIRAIMEQNQNPADLTDIGDVKTLTLESLIANMLEEAVAMAVMNADEGLFDSVDRKSYVKKLAEEEEGGTGDIEPTNPSQPITAAYDADEKPTALQSLKEISLPEDCLRIWSVEADSWDGVARTVMSKESSMYRMCKNKYVMSVGVSDRPMAFKSWKGSGSRSLELFPEPKKMVMLTYTKKPVIKGEEIECDQNLYEGACFYCAYLVAMTQGWQNANGYLQEAAQALQTVNKAAAVAAAAQQAAAV